MENRNQSNSPRDRIDDALLIRLLNEEEPMPEYTCTGERRNPAGSCRSSRSTTGRSGRYDPPEQRNPGCGCAGSREQRNSGCGCEAARERRDSECGCADLRKLAGYPLAMVYAPDHEWDDMYDEEEALSRGTLFRPLDLPFYPGKCGGSCGCR